MRITGISIIIACFNGGKWIRDSLASVLNQVGDREFEVIVVDDCSQDDTIEIVRSLNDSRIRIYRNQVNIGTAKSRNLGIEHARYPWIAFNDQDDIWLPDKLAKQCSALEKNAGLEGIAGGYARLDKDGQSRWKVKICHKTWSPSHCPVLDAPPDYDPAKHGICYIQSLLVQKSALKKINGFRENLPLAYDPDLFLRLGEVSKLAALEEPVFLYRLTSSSITGSSTLNAKDFLGGFAFMYAAQAARAMGQSEPDLFDFLRQHQPSRREVRTFLGNQSMRSINTQWVSHGLWRAVLTAGYQLIRNPWLVGNVFSRFLHWK